MTSWADLMQQRTTVVNVEGLDVELQTITAGQLAACVDDAGEVSVFRVISATVKNPPITASEAENLSPKALAILADECGKINGTSDPLE